VSTFSADWLALREPHDARARNPKVLDALADHVKARGSIGVVDLACGTGSTLRATAPRLAPRQDWLLVDNDLGLLARAGAMTTLECTSVSTVPVDLARDLEAALDGPINLVTTSALLDLVSAAWLERLIVETATRTLPLYAAITYDGEVMLEPADPLDEAVIAAVNRHQRGDKGFGPALGPVAALTAIRGFERAGYVVISGKSDWVIGPADQTFQAALVAGWSLAAREIGDIASAEIAAWVTRRGNLIAAGRSRMRVGHVDLFAQPTGRRWADRSQSNSTSSPSG
jgi:hypothetical protein